MKHGILVPDSTMLCEFWYKHLGHFHYGAIPLLENLVQGLLKFKIEKEGVYKIFRHGKYNNISFPSSGHRKICVWTYAFCVLDNEFVLCYFY